MERVGFWIVMGLALVASPSCVSPSSRTLPAPYLAGASQPNELAPGLVYSRADRDGKGGQINWFVSFGVARSPQEFEMVTRCANPFKLPRKSLPFVFSGTPNQPYAEIIAGEFSSRSEAQAYLDLHPVTSPCSAEVKASGLYPSDTSTPVVIHVLTLDPAIFKGQLIAARGMKGAANRAKPSAVMKAHGGLAATNGGYFVMEPSDGVVGESAGISVIAGQLESEPSHGRPWVEIRNQPHIQVTLHFSEPTLLPALVAGSGRRILIDGVNREPGILRNCGALHVKILAQPIHDGTCKPKDEIVALMPGSGISIGADANQVTYRLTQSGHLVAYNADVITAGHLPIIAARGSRRSELRELAETKTTVNLALGEFGKRADVYALNGGPILVSKGLPQRLADGQGWPMQSATWEQANAMHRFVTLRAPRTAIGTTLSGKVLLVVIDGWRYRQDTLPQVPMNGGATLAELADIMRDLGAEEALNLDGGGSSVMALHTGLVSHPSDAEGERAVGDSLVVLPNSR